jgi:hypothetical protein
MNPFAQLLDVVALTADIPELGLSVGQVGTVVELLSEQVFEVEFSDDNGVAYAMAAIPQANLLALHYAPSKVALSARSGFRWQ